MQLTMSGSRSPHGKRTHSSRSLMALTGTKIFVSYSREDAEFAARLCDELKALGAAVSSYAPAGPLAISHHFIAAVSTVVVVLSPNAVNSALVRNQIEIATQSRKTIFPVILKPCEIPGPLQLYRPLPDFSEDFNRGLSALVFQMEASRAVEVSQQSEAGAPATDPFWRERQKAAQDMKRIMDGAGSNARENNAPAVPANNFGPDVSAALQDVMKQRAETTEKAVRKWDALIESAGTDTKPSEQPTAFVSYSREDLEFVRRLAQDLKAAGARVWMDKLDIRPGQKWAKAVAEALEKCNRLLVVLSPSSVKSANVDAEINEVLESGKEVIPIIYRDCKNPFLLKPFQYADFRADYSEALKELLAALKD